MAVRDSDPARAQQALEQLCQTYWYPLYAYARLNGFPPPEAEDLVQGFFAHLFERETFKKADPERGRFRCFLISCLRKYMADQRDRAACQKRGGGSRTLSLDVEKAEQRYQLQAGPADNPDAAFDRHWALTAIDKVFDRLEAESAAAGTSQMFAHLKDAIAGEKGPTTYAQLAQAMAMSEHEVRLTVYRLRKRYRALFREEIAQLVLRPEDVDDEIAYLFQVLSS